MIGGYLTRWKGRQENFRPKHFLFLNVPHFSLNQKLLKPEYKVDLIYITTQTIFAPWAVKNKIWLLVIHILFPSGPYSSNHKLWWNHFFCIVLWRRMHFKSPTLRPRNSINQIPNSKTNKKRAKDSSLGLWIRNKSMWQTIFTNLRNKKYRLNCEQWTSRNNEHPGSKCVFKLKSVFLLFKKINTLTVYAGISAQKWRQRRKQWRSWRREPDRQTLVADLKHRKFEVDKEFSRHFTTLV